MNKTHADIYSLFFLRDCCRNNSLRTVSKTWNTWNWLICPASAIDILPVIGNPSVHGRLSRNDLSQYVLFSPTTPNFGDTFRKRLFVNIHSVNYLHGDGFLLFARRLFFSYVILPMWTFLILHQFFVLCYNYSTFQTRWRETFWLIQWSSAPDPGNI